MINARVIYNDAWSNIDFPCESNYLEAKLMELHVEDQTNAQMFIDKIEGVRGLEFMEKNFIDIDELNFLANKINCFDKREIQKFEAVVPYKKWRDFPIKKLSDFTLFTACYETNHNILTPTLRIAQL